MTVNSAQQDNRKCLGSNILWLLAVSICALSCTESPEKPIPPLNPSLAEEEPAEPPVAPTKPGQVTRMPLGDLYQLVQRNAAVTYDVRPTFYYSIGHVPGAISWPKAAFERDLAKHEPRIRVANAGNTPVVI
jgi:hypothetical protein